MLVASTYSETRREDAAGRGEGYKYAKNSKRHQRQRLIQRVVLHNVIEYVSQVNKRARNGTR